MINKLSYKECMVCEACVNICPQKCININTEIATVNYPIIDEDKCINCGMCEKVCPIISKFECNSENNKVYAAMNLDNYIKQQSSSGGIFSLIAEEFLNNNGYVSGVTFDNSFKSKHIIIDDVKDLYLIRGSKYLQSENNYVYSEIKNILNSGKQVLFSGCPCQVAGLKSYLQGDYDNLTTVDIICHGIPSQRIFKEYVRILEKKYRSKIASVNFRDKSTGWHNSSIKITFENNKEYKKLIIDDIYMKGYFQNIILKESCYRCKYRSFKSGSDITLGDFWGAEILHNDVDYEKGLSIIIINSNKGNLLFNKVKHNMFIKESNIQEGYRYNKCLYNSPEKNKKREDFFKEVDKNGYEEAFYKMCKDEAYITIKKVIRRKASKIKRILQKNNI